MGRYHNTDPVLINYLIRLAVEKRGEEYLSFPQRALFDKVGIRTMVIETDPFGNLLTQGYEFTSGRDWASYGGGTGQEMTLVELGLAPGCACSDAGASINQARASRRTKGDRWTL